MTEAADTRTTAPPVTVYTLGHSRHSMAHFIALLGGHRIRQVIDVRGQPFSRFNPQFNRETLRDALRDADIEYVWLGDRLSGRPKEADFYGADGRVLWEKLRHWPALHAGLEEVLIRAGHGRVAMICAEEDPMRCHRRFLLTPPLVERGAQILHIRGDGRIEPETELATRERAGRSQLDLFGDDGE